MRIERMTTMPEAPAKTLTQLVALEIRLEMVRQDVLQSQLARKIGKTEQWLSVRLRGRQPIDLNDLALIAAGLGVAVGALLPRPVLSGEGVTALYPQVTERTTRSTREPRGHRPNGYPDASVAPGNRRTARATRPGVTTRP